MSRRTKNRFQLGPWRVFPDQGLLEGPDGQEHLEPKVMDVLVFLAGHQGEVVKRDELIAKVWHGTLVTDEALSRAISVLRTRLGDDRMTPLYIQTVPKVGYRLLMPVSEIPSENEPSRSRFFSSRSWIYALISVLLIGVFILFFSSDEAPPDPRSPAAFATIAEWFDFLQQEKEGTDGVTYIAVLPFENLTEDPEDEALSDSLTDELTISLSKVKGLRVVARRSSYSFKNRTDDVPTIGRMLNVDAIFEGTVLETDGQIRINALLSSVEDGYLIWSDSFECDTSELYRTQELLAAAVVQSLQKTFSGQGLEWPPRQVNPPNIEAYQLYLMAPNFLWKMRGEQPLRKSIELFRSALAIDPTFSRAYVGLAYSLVLLPFYSSEAMEPLFREAEELLASHEFTDKRDLGEAESIYAFIAWQRWRWIEAEERFRKALELAPDSPNIYQWYSQHLAHVGRKLDSLTAARRARDLDEVSPVINDRLGVAYLWLNDNVRAAEHFAIGAELGFRNALNPGYMVLLVRLERYEELKAVLKAFHYGQSHIPQWLIDNTAIIFDPKQRRKAIALARKAQAEGDPIMPRLQFGLWVTLGANDEAYETIDRLRDGSRQFLQLEYIWAEEGQPFRKDSRFDDFARDIGWNDYWKKYGGPDDE